MRVLAGLCVVLLASACAGRNGVVTPVPTGDESGERQPCVGCPAGVETAPDTDAADVEAATDSVTIDVEAACARVARLVEAGEHKPAVDALDSLLEAGAACEQTVLDAVAASRRTLSDADALVHRGLEARREGDFEAARRSFRQAREIYPKYYWTERLERSLPADPSARIAELRAEAASLLSAGRPEEAMQRLEEAAGLAPARPELSQEIARIRADLADERLREAHAAQQSGDLERAVDLTELAVAAKPEPPVRDRVIDFARRLGLNLFSAGELLEAQAVWQAAITLDQGNELLRRYLDEVDSRLRSLARIKEGGGE